MFSKSTNIRYSMFIAIALLFFSSFYLTLIGFDRSILLSQENQEEKNIEQTIIPENLPFDSQIFNSDSSLSGFDVWGQPMRITAENLQRNEYDIYQDETGKYHFVYIKEVTTHGMGLAYSCSTNDSATEWSLEEIIITVEATIIKPKIIVDNDQNIHIGYFSAREDYYRVNYLNKSSSSVNWGAEKILNSTRTHTPLELIFGKTNTTVHMSWIFSEKGKTAQTWNSKIIFLSKLNNASVWTRTENDSFNLINPLRMDFKALTNGTIILLCSVWAEDYLNNTILITRSNDFGVNWNAFNEIYEYNRKIGYVYVQPSIISDNCHIVFVSQNSPRILFYFKVLTNGTVNGTVDQISQQLANSFFAGIVENNQTKNLHLVYEEMQDNRYNIFQRTKLAGNTTWEAATKVTNDDTSLDPIMLQSNIDGSTHFGQLFYLSEYSVFAKSYNSSENWQLDNELLRTSRFEDDPSFVIDSEGTMHLVVEHLIPPYSEIRYYRKEIGESWTFEGSLTETWWTQATSPKIISDSNDNIHCLFIAEEQTFHDDTLYYRTLNKGTNNWSAPLLITTPAEPAVDYHLEFLADVSNTLHIIWIESTGTDRNRMVYSTKSEMATNFTTEIIQDNPSFTESLHPDAVIDSLGNIYLVYSLTTADSWTSKIEYREKPFSGNWSDPVTIAATSEDILYKPMLTINDLDNIEMVYQRRYYTGASSLAVDVHHWIKNSLINPWEYSGMIIDEEYLTAHNFYILPNGTRCFIFHSNTFIIIDSYVIAIDNVYIMYQFTDKSWSQRELVQAYPQGSFEPLVQYDSNTDNLYFIVMDEYSDYTRINLLGGQIDTDSDLLGDFDEGIFGTNATNPDSDQDQLLDGFEILTSYTNPALNDTDWDWLSDGAEYLNYLSNPLLLDSDGDSLTDGEEILIYSTNPTRRDSDSDGIDDDIEIFVYGTNPADDDSDGDLIPDLYEIINGLDPLVDDAYDDADNDDLYNLEEYNYGTDPNNPDSDSDDLTDGDEVKIWKTNPLAFDTDLDTLSDSDEVLVYHTNPNSADSDGDGYTDREEINAGTDPNDPRDNVLLRKVKTTLLATLIPLFSIIIFFGIFEFRYRILSKKVSQEEKDELLDEEEKLTSLLDEKYPEVEK